MTTRRHSVGAALLPLVAVVALGCGGGGGGTTSDGGACPSGQTLCSATCTNTRIDPQNCGACGHACTNGEVCVGSTCSVVCPPGLTECSGSCTNTDYDPQHCGGCSTACAEGQVCASGSCGASCPAGMTDCDGACVDTLLDPQHCGNCTTACNGGETCAVGACLLLCPPGQTNCSGACTNTTIDPKHCGSCATACTADQICVGGACASFCAAGTTWCSGACADLTRDADHCGACATACATGLQCHASRCSAPRAGGTVDSWGELWDGFPRPAAAWADAQAACAAVGGRLPTVTELYRVNATTGTGELGDITLTAYLWSAVPWDATMATTVRLSDGTVSSAQATALVAYRCVWPDVTDAFFGANACYGPPGAPCTAAAGRPGFNFDAWERPPVTYLAASVECGQLHARVPLEVELVEAITGSPALGSGSNNYIWTADQGNATNVQLVRWTGSEPTTYTDVAPYVTWAAKSGAYRFRCLGADHDTGTHPATITGEYVATTTRLKGESADRAADGLAPAVSACFDAGGHLPLVRDLVELVEAGLPAGSNVALWTADATGYAHNEYLMWSGVKTTFAGVGAEANWSDRLVATTHPFRCAYLPVNASYTTPTGCNGGCFSVTKGPVTTYSDTFDRSPVTYVEAVKACVADGGHLASFRDLFELIRAGLPNGSAAALWTSDAAGGDPVATPDPALTMTVHWTATAAAFDGTYSTYAGSSTRAGTASAAFRCVWTNEYR